MFCKILIRLNTCCPSLTLVVGFGMRSMGKYSVLHKNRYRFQAWSHLAGDATTLVSNLCSSLVNFSSRKSREFVVHKCLFPFTRNKKQQHFPSSIYQSALNNLINANRINFFNLCILWFRAQVKSIDSPFRFAHCSIVLTCSFIFPAVRHATLFVFS